MSLSSAASEEDIVARIKEIPGVDVMEGEYASDSWKPVIDSNKLFKPYMLIKFNGSFQTFDNGVVSPAWDTLRASFSVYVVAPSDKIARSLRDQVRIKMLDGFLPTDGSTLRPTGGFSLIDPDLGYHRYVHNIGFAYTHNLNPTS